MDIAKIIILVALILYILISFILGNVIINVIFKANRQTFSDIEKQDSKFLSSFIAYEHYWDRHPFELLSEDVTIHGEYIINPKDNGTPKKVVIICHGHNAMRAACLKYAGIFYDLGYNLVIFDQRYFGDSTGKICTLGLMESRDIANIIKYTRSVFGQDAFLGLHGESMGAASEIQAQKFVDQAPDFIIADCPFCSTRRLLNHLAKVFSSPLIYRAAVWWAHIIGKIRGDYNFDLVRPEKVMKNIKTPICFIHGEADKFIPCEHSLRLYSKALNPDSELHLIEGATHAASNATDPDGYREIVTKFVKKVEQKSYHKINAI